MFKNKHLKQLQEVQSKIKNCQASIEKLSSPELDTHKDRLHVYNVLRPMLYGSSLSPGEFLELSDASIDYVQQVGQFLLNITDYVDKIRKYKTEIAQLQKEELCLKAKLGIT